MWHDGNLTPSNYLVGTSNPSTVGNFTLSIGNDGSKSYVQSHASQPLYLNPVFAGTTQTHRFIANYRNQ